MSLLPAAAAASAAGPAPALGVPSWSPGLAPWLTLLLVLVAIPLVLWLVRRSGLAPVGAPGLMRQVGQLPLSPTQRLLIVELSSGGVPQWLVLGVSPDRIQTLATLDRPPTGVAPGELAQPHAATVDALLTRWRGGRPAGGPAPMPPRPPGAGGWEDPR